MGSFSYYMCGLILLILAMLATVVKLDEHDVQREKYRAEARKKEKDER